MRSSCVDLGCDGRALTKMSKPSDVADLTEFCKGQKKEKGSEGTMSRKDAETECDTHEPRSRGHDTW